MTVLFELGQYLEDMGVATHNVLFLGSRPEEPDTVLVVYEYPGGAPQYVQEHAAPIIERPQIQVVSRALKYEDADALIHDAWLALASIANAVLGGVKYLSVRPNGSPGILDRDHHDRVLLFFNASVEKEVSFGVS